MSKITVIKNTITKFGGRGLLILKKYSPEILTGVGIVGMIGSTVLACKATLNVDKVLDENKEQKDKIKKTRAELKDSKNEHGEIKHSAQAYNQDMTKVTIKTAWDLIKLYGPAGTLCLTSVACILGGHKILKTRNVAIAAAYKTMEQAFANYRENVVKFAGAESDNVFKYGKTEEDVEHETTDEEGNVKKEMKQAVSVTKTSDYARYFDASCSNWSPVADYNLTFIKCQQNYANDLLKTRGHVLLNEVYDMLGMKRSSAGAVVGWVDGHGDSFIDFGTVHGDESNMVFVNGRLDSILLDFNVDGIVYDLI